MKSKKTTKPATEKPADSALFIAPKVSRATMRKSMLLLDMEYKPAEIADELKVTDRTILRTWLPGGLPFRKDNTGHVWIVGTQARAWLETIASQNAEKPRKALAPDQAFCARCNAAVEPVNVTKVPFQRSGMLKGNCPVCGKAVNRFIKASEV
jgi:hypothetical protein